MSSMNIAPKIISSLPPYASSEEHKALTSTTPESFASIPPILRLEEPNVSVSFDPPLQDFGPDDCKHGKLYIIERCT
jgi:nucleotide-sensitive chloride channel 1A